MDFDMGKRAGDLRRELRELVAEHVPEHGVGRVWPDARTSSRAGGCAVANSSPAACASRRAARVAEQAGPRWVGVG